MECEVKFKIGQKIVYPLQGVGEIVGIDEQIFKEVLTPYYTIYIPVSDMTVMIPVSNTETLGIRAFPFGLERTVPGEYGHAENRRY